MQRNIIYELESQLKAKFNLVDLATISTFKGEQTTEYSMDENGYITGLCITDFEIKAIPEIISECNKLIALNMENTNIFSNIKLSYISPLEKLTCLKFLDLSGNFISNLSALANLTNLTVLNLTQNKIINILSLEKLTALKDLFISANKISDISALSNLTNITRLEIDINKISNISSIENLLSNPKVTINLDNNSLNETSVQIIEKHQPELIRKLSKRLKIRFKKVYLSDIQHLKRIKTAEYATDEKGNVTGICISCMPPHLFTHFFDVVNELSKSLVHLNLMYNQITDISQIEKFTNLTNLWLSFNLISDISSLKSLKELTRLEFQNNKISDISALKNMKNIQTIDLRNNPIKKVPEWICNFNNPEIQWKPKVLKLGFISFYNNPIENIPIETLKKGKLAIQAFFQNKNYEEKI